MGKLYGRSTSKACSRPVTINGKRPDHKQKTAWQALLAKAHGHGYSQGPGLCGRYGTGENLHNGRQARIPFTGTSGFVCPTPMSLLFPAKLFERVQEVLRQTSEKDEKPCAVPQFHIHHTYSKAKCFAPTAIHPMHRHRQNKDGTYWYRCESQWKYHKGACYQVSVKEEEIKTEVFCPTSQACRSNSGRAYPHRAHDAGEKCRRRDRADGGQPGACFRGHFLKSLYENMVARAD